MPRTKRDSPASACKPRPAVSGHSTTTCISTSAPQPPPPLPELSPAVWPNRNPCHSPRTPRLLRQEPTEEALSRRRPTRRRHRQHHLQLLIPPWFRSSLRSVSSTSDSSLSCALRDSPKGDCAESSYTLYTPASSPMHHVHIFSQHFYLISRALKKHDTINMNIDSSVGHYYYCSSIVGAAALPQLLPTATPPACRSFPARAPRYEKKLHRHLFLRSQEIKKHLNIISRTLDSCSPSHIIRATGILT